MIRSRNNILNYPHRKILGSNVLSLEAVNSTNSYLLADPSLLKQAGLVVVADKQLSGKGRLGRIWESGNNANLFCSIVIQPKFSREWIPSISLLIGLSVFRVLTSLGIKKVSVKWPNDILIHDKKVCGILCEATTINHSEQVIIAGIGINLFGDIDQFSKELEKNVITLEEVYKESFSRDQILYQLLDELDEIFNNLDENKFKQLIQEWEGSSSSIGKKIKYLSGEVYSEGLILGLNKFGHLLVESKGEIKTIYSGEVFFCPNNSG